MCCLDGRWKHSHMSPGSERNQCHMRWRGTKKGERSRVRQEGRGGWGPGGPPGGGSPCTWPWVESEAGRVGSGCSGGLGKGQEAETSEHPCPLRGRRKFEAGRRRPPAPELPAGRLGFGIFLNSITVKVQNMAALHMSSCGGARKQVVSMATAGSGFAPLRSGGPPGGGRQPRLIPRP